MKKTFLLGLLLGIGGAVWLAGWYPFVDPVRFASESGVARNGGRTESFRIQIPEDRVLGAAAPGSVVPSVPAGLSLPEVAGDGAVEIYKLRNASGKVIGLASRIRGGDAAYTDWTLMLPARGALFLTAAGSEVSPHAMATAMATAGVAADPAGQSPTSPTFRILGDVAGGSGEFAGFFGSFSEEWEVAGRDAEGRLVGDIEIMTLTQIGTRPGRAAP
ncbi:hypothetical protein [Lentisalinibacter salinarum]|uniref:hypothetical protein n=1 Tax=Lentisalinibacter salinarum TaxID=2992239 RepID=UPI003866AA21